MVSFGRCHCYERRCNRVISNKTQKVNKTPSLPPLPERKSWTLWGGYNLNGDCLASSYGVEIAVERVSKTKVYSNHIKNQNMNLEFFFSGKYSDWKYFTNTINENFKYYEKGMNQITYTQKNHSQTCHQRHLCQTRYQRKRNAIRRKSILSIGTMTRQTHLRATILILLMTVNTYASNAKRGAIGKRIRSNYAHIQRQSCGRQYINQR